MKIKIDARMKKHDEKDIINSPYYRYIGFNKMTIKKG